MSSIASEAPLRLELRPSRALGAFLLASHLGAAGCVLAVALPGWTQVAVGLALAASLTHGLRRYALLLDGQAVVSLAWGSDRLWRLGLREGRTLEADPADHALVHPWLVVLSLRAVHGGRRLSVPIAGDMLDPETHRRLRVRLTLERAAS